VLNGLHQEGTEVLLITGVLSRELRSLIEILEDAADKNLSAALQSARIWPKRKPLVQKLLQRSSLGDLTALHSRLSEVDAMVKGAKAGDPWAVLAEISLALSGQTIAVSPLPDRHHG
jgi:DNA polymerase-3 subunit delta